MQVKKCLYCEKEFEDIRSKTKLYCCRSCKTKYLYKKIPDVEKNCLYCGGRFVMRHGGKGQVYCSRKCFRKYFREHLMSEESKERERRLDVLRHRANPLIKYNSIKSSTRYRKKSFNISYKDFLEKFWNKPCHYCGDIIDGGGIDRVDSSVGYEIDNCVPCCGTCNRLKMNLTLSDFFSQINKIYNKHLI